MFTNFKNRLASVIAQEMPATLPVSPPGDQNNVMHRLHVATYHPRLAQQKNQQHLKDKFVYSRPSFLQLLTPDELKASADHNVRPIIVPRDITLMPWHTGYAECVNSGKSEWNEDQAAFHRRVLADPTKRHPDLPYTYFGIFDGHAGFGAALAASHQFHHILHEKLVDCLELLLPRDGMDEDVANNYMKTKNSSGILHPNQFHRAVSKDELIIGALENAFFHMDALIALDRDRYRDAGGCTACVALFIYGKIYIANAGDSRAVLCKKKYAQCEGDGFYQHCDGSEGSYAVPMSFDHTPETEKNRLFNVALYKPHLMGKYYSAMEYSRRPHEKDLGQRILCRQGTNKGWAYKTVTRDDLKMPVVTGEGKRSRLLGTLGVTRGFGDHDLLAIASGMILKPFLTPQPDVNFYDLTKIVSIPDEHNEDGDYGILVMGTDGLWDVSENEAVARTVFQTLHKYPRERHRYTMVAQELVARARGKINDYGHWRLADSKAAATVDDISVIVIPIYQYYKEHIEQEQKYMREYQEQKLQQRGRPTLKDKTLMAKEATILVNGTTEMAQMMVVESPSSLGTKTLQSVPSESEWDQTNAMGEAICEGRQEKEVEQTLEALLDQVSGELATATIDDRTAVTATTATEASDTFHEGSATAAETTTTTTTTNPSSPSADNNATVAKII